MHPRKPLTRRDVLAMLAVLGLPASRPARAQDPSKINPRSYKVAFENERLRVLEYFSKPGLGVCGKGMHSHPAHLTIPLTDAKVKVTLPDGKVILAEGKAGEMFWSPGETHTTENVSGKNVRAYMVEMKDADWKPSTG
jgi:hypothetical protein